jgi:predicted PurR-regulated permease PerM
VYEFEYKKIKVPPFVTEMCVFLGAYHFGTQGIIIGPLLTCVIMIFYDLIKDYSPDI